MGHAGLRSRAVRTLACLAAGLCGVGASVAVAADENARGLAAQIASDAAVKKRTALDVRVLRVMSDSPKQDGRTPPAEDTVAYAISYSRGRAWAIHYDAKARKVTAIDTLRGLPQPSAQEQKEAREIVAKDQDLGALLRHGHELRGGFGAAGPKGVPARYVQFHLVAPPDTKILRRVVVDLVSSRVVLSESAPFPGERRP